jgi:hypothetical protein
MEVYRHVTGYSENNMQKNLFQVTRAKKKGLALRLTP